MAEVSYEPNRALRRLKNGDKRITYLCFKNKKYEDAIVSDLFDYLIEHPDGLIGANICLNHFTDVTGAKIAKWIEKSNTLQSLIMTNNHFGEITYLAIANAVRVNSSLKEILLFDNKKVDVERVKAAFGAAINVNPLLFDCNWMLIAIKNEFPELLESSSQTSSPPSMLQLLLSTHVGLRQEIGYFRFLS